MIKTEELTGFTGYRPRGWEIIAAGIVQRYQRSVMAAICDDDAAKQRAVGEAFATALLEALRKYNGCQALVRNNNLYAVVYKGGKYREIDLDLTYIGDWGFSGPGRMVFIPDDPQGES